MTSSRACSMKLRWTVNSLLSILNFVGFFSTIRAYVLRMIQKIQIQIKKEFKFTKFTTPKFIYKFLLSNSFKYRSEVESKFKYVSTFTQVKFEFDDQIQIRLSLNWNFRLEKDIDRILEIVEVPLDGTKCFSQLSGGPVELVRMWDRCGWTAQRHTAGRRRDRDIVQLAPTPIQAAILVQRLAHLAETVQDN